MKTGNWLVVLWHRGKMVAGNGVEEVNGGNWLVVLWHRVKAVAGEEVAG